MESRIFSYLPWGYHGQLIEVEVEIRRGLPSIDIIGLAGTAVREARERVRFACQNAGYTFPPDRIVINLRPAGLSKQGTSYDLAIALAILQASGQISLGDGAPLLVLGELGLSGRVGPVDGVLAALICARDQGIGQGMVPAANLEESRHAAGLRVRGLSYLGELHDSKTLLGPGPEPAVKTLPDPVQTGLFDRMVGQEDYKLALALSAAGGHHLLVFGPPGTGKTMGLNALRDLWPPLSPEAGLESRRLMSLAGQGGDQQGSNQCSVPFRMPHHSASLQALLGGGNPVRPGEVSLAHGGVLVLDEAPEFQGRVLQGLREPLEAGSISISRAGSSHWFPARSTVYLSMNPCPCGNLGRQGSYCSCRPQDVRSYWGRLGGPLLDRLDIRLGLYGDGARRSCHGRFPHDFASLYGAVQGARERQGQRNRKGLLNGQGGFDLQAERCDYEPALQSALDAMEQDSLLSRRAVGGVVRLARTIADMRGEDLPDLGDLQLARAFRETESDLPGFGVP